MDKKRRAKQNAVIILGILIVIAFLWRLRHGQAGGFASGAATNILGATTLTVLGGAPAPSPPNNIPTPISNAVVPIDVNTTPGGTNPPSTTSAPASPPALSSNLVNTNGPTTVIDVPSADLVETPPGVIAAPTAVEATSIESRLGAANAQGGDIQISLSWNNVNDLDLHCIDPKGEEIWFSNRRSSKTGGELDVDQNAHFPFTPTPVENIFWATHSAPSGLYRVFVSYYSPRPGLGEGAPTGFTVRIAVRDWKTYFFKSTISFTGRAEPKPICTLRYDPANPEPAKRFAFVR